MIQVNARRDAVGLAKLIVDAEASPLDSAIAASLPRGRFAASLRRSTKAFG